MVTATTYREERATVGSFMDITERKGLEETLRQSEEKYRTILDEMDEGYFETDLAGNFTSVNDSNCRHLGYSREELLGANFRVYIPEEDVETMYKAFNKVYRTGKPERGISHKVVRKDGKTGFAETSAFPLQNQQGETIGFRGIGRDITERKLIEQQLNHMATHDPLTGLPNRMLFIDRLAVALAQAKRNSQKLAVIMLDLDRFKDVNDSLGHSVGDQLLINIGNRLAGLLRQSDTIARMGGDEFMILLPKIERMKDAAEVAQKVLNAFQQPFMLDSHKFHVTASVGIATFPDDSEEADGLLNNADVAMYRAKEQGQNNYQLFQCQLS
jgi:diguanylate cyclase (GGDEF)-like protein/PAS domain S-box-containing protein